MTISCEKKNVEAVHAQHGEKMIEVKLRFWTNDIAEEPDMITPKHAWTKGVVRMESNKSHGIKPLNPKPFQSLLDIGSVIEETLIEHGIVLHVCDKMKKYID